MKIFGAMDESSQPQEEKLAMNIVNQLYDLAEVPVDKRQSINDKADTFVLNLLQPLQSELRKKTRLKLEVEQLRKSVGQQLLNTFIQPDPNFSIHDVIGKKHD